MSQLQTKIENSSFSIFVKRQLLEEVKNNPTSPRIIELLESARTTISTEDAQEIKLLFTSQS